MDITVLKEEFPNPISAQDGQDMESDMESGEISKYCIGGALCMYFGFADGGEFDPDACFPNTAFLASLLHVKFGLPYLRDAYIDSASAENSSQCGNDRYYTYTDCKNNDGFLCWTDEPEMSASEPQNSSLN